MSGPVIRRPAVESPSVLDSSMERAIKALARFLGGDDPNSQVLGMLNPTEVAAGPVAKAIAALAKRLPNPIKAYHGSPHDFDKFSLDKIGTGEGAQAYGHGLYFAENEGVARNYRDALEIKRTPQDVGARYGLDEQEAQYQIAQWQKYKKINPSEAHLFKADPPKTPADRLRNDVIDGKFDGKMYEVNIHADPDDFLDWDAPLSQQSEKVRQALAREKLVDPDANANRTGAMAYLKAPDQLADQGRAPIMSNRSRGEDATDAMRKAGIPGIKYYDGASRGAKDGTRNYVVFDDKLIEIVKKYGIAVATAGGLINEAQAQQLKEQGYQ